MRFDGIVMYDDGFYERMRFGAGWYAWIPCIMTGLVVDLCCCFLHAILMERQVWLVK